LTARLPVARLTSSFNSPIAKISYVGKAIFDYKTFHTQIFVREYACIHIFGAVTDKVRKESFLSHNDSSYFMNANTMAESARLLAQDRLVTATVSLLPPGIDGKSLHRVLDVGCGPAVWLLDLVAKYPHIGGIGVDNSESMLETARLLQKATSTSPCSTWM
jgi:SAM-dependent methyltransferase